MACTEQERPHGAVQPQETARQGSDSLKGSSIRSLQPSSHISYAPGASGCNVWTLARIAGHSSIGISARYVHPSEDAVLTAMSSLGGHNSGHSDEVPPNAQPSEKLLNA